MKITYILQEPKRKNTAGATSTGSAAGLREGRIDTAGPPAAGASFARCTGACGAGPDLL